MPSRGPRTANAILNKECHSCKNKDNRYTNEFGICTTVKSIEDKLPVRCIGEWGVDKIYYLTRYFDIFANGMKNLFTLNYVEICSGPGRCICRESKEEIDGTPLSILKQPSFANISKAIFIDKSKEVVETLNTRIISLGKAQKAKALFGDYSDIDSLKSAFSTLNKKSLTLIFIDPTDCSIPFATIDFLAKYFERVDFIINVATYTDIGRNLRNIFERGYSDEKYKDFLGKNFENVSKKMDFSKINSSKARILFKQAYIENFKSIGFKYSELEKIANYYDLLFVTANERGLDFWKKISKIRPDNQRTLGL